MVGDEKEKNKENDEMRENKNEPTILYSRIIDSKFIVNETQANLDNRYEFSSKSIRR